VAVVVALTESPAVADDRVVTANGTSPRQQLQRDHPGSMLSFASGSAIKRITAGVKARRWPFPAKVSICWSGLHPPAKSVSNERRILLFVCGREPLTPSIGRYKGTSGQSQARSWLHVPESGPTSGRRCWGI